MRFWIAIVFTVGIVLQANSQASNYDSLIKAAMAAPKDSTRVLLLNEASVALREADNNQALVYAKEAEELANQLDFRRGLGIVLSNIGWIYYRKGDYVKALEISTEALRVDNEFGDQKEIASCFNNIGAINFEQKLYEAALKNFKTAYKLAKEVNHRVSMSRSLNNLAFCFIKLHQLDSARAYTLRAIEEHVNDNFRTAFSKRTLGDISFEEGNFKEALRNFEECLALANKQNNNFLKASTQYRIGNTYLKLNNPDKALQYLDTNILLVKKFGYRSEMESTYKATSEAYLMKRDFSKAYEFLILYHQMKDSLIEQRNSEKLTLIQDRYNSEIKNTQIELLTKSSLLKENEIKTQRKFIYIGVGILAVMSVSLFILQRSKAINAAANRLLAANNELINKQTNELLKLNATKDKIFSIIGHDIRSPLAGLQGLLNLAVSSAMTQQEFADVSKNLKKNLDYVRSDLDNLLHWANAQLNGIEPNFGNCQLQKLIAELVNLHSELAKAKQVELTNEVPENIEVWADINHVRLIIRNLISNAIKFCRPGNGVKITSSLNAGRVKIEVADTGLGMSDEEVQRLFKIDTHFTKLGTQNERGVGLGLVLVKEFVQFNKGSITVYSKQGHGSTFTIFLEGAHSSTG